MNILYFFTYGYSLKTWSESGQLDREIRHFEKLHEKNNEIKFILITYGTEKDLKYFEKDYIEIIPIYKYLKKSKYKLLDFFNSIFFYKTIEKVLAGKPKLILQNQLLGCWVAFIFKKKLKIPMIIRTGYDMYEFSIREKKKFYKRILYKYLTLFGLAKCDLYTVTSNCDKEFLTQKFKQKYIDKIKIRKNWIDANGILDLENKRFEFNKLISIGRLESQKNYPLIFQAIKNTNFQLDIYGEGSQKQELYALAKNLNIKVNFMGILNNEELIRELTKYQFYITASIYEGNPKSVLESMISGCIVIASNIKNHIEFLNESNALLFKSENLKDLKAVLNKIQKKLDLKELKSNSISTVKTGYNLNVLTEKELEDYYYLVS